MAIKTLTTKTIAGNKVLDTVGVVYQPIIVGNNILNDTFFRKIRSIFGGRAQGLEKVRRDAISSGFADLEAQAEAMGANAILDVRLTSSNVIIQSGKNKVSIPGTDYAFTTAKNVTLPMITLIGTAVIIDLPGAKPLGQNLLRSTTATTLGGRKITEHLDIVMEPVSVGFNFINETFGGWREIIGGRARGIEKAIQSGWNDGICSFLDTARQIGADAVVDVTMTNFSVLENDSMLSFVLTGTGVKSTKADPS